MPDYSNHAFRYDHYEDRDHETPRRSTARRLHRSSRRSRKRTSSTPQMTVNARRGRRWSW
ncbi:MAG: hypothetical protein AAF266_15025 [Planctomycetota bacterium]